MHWQHQCITKYLCSQDLRIAIYSSDNRSWVRRHTGKPRTPVWGIIFGRFYSGHAWETEHNWPESDAVRRVRYSSRSVSCMPTSRIDDYGTSTGFQIVLRVLVYTARLLISQANTIRATVRNEAEACIQNFNLRHCSSCILLIFKNIRIPRGLMRRFVLQTFPFQ